MQDPPGTPPAVMPAQKPAKQRKQTVKFALQENAPAPCKAQSHSSRWDALHAEKRLHPEKRLLAKQMLAGAGNRPVQGTRSTEVPCAGQNGEQASTEQQQRPALLPVGQVPAATASAQAAAKPAMAPAQAEAQREAVVPAQVAAQLEVVAPAPAHAAANLALHEAAAAATGSAAGSCGSLSDPLLGGASVPASSTGLKEAMAQHNRLSPQAPAVLNSTQQHQHQQATKQGQSMADSSAMLEADSPAVLGRCCSVNPDVQCSADADAAAEVHQIKQQEPQLPPAHWYEAPAGYGPPGSRRFVPAADYCVSTQDQQPRMPHDNADLQCSADADPLAAAWLQEVVRHSMQLPPAQWVSAPAGYGPPGSRRFVHAAGTVGAMEQQQRQGQQEHRAEQEQEQQQMTDNWSWLEGYGPEGAACTKCVYLPPASSWPCSNARVSKQV